MAIEAYWSADVSTFLLQEPQAIAQQLAYATQQRFRVNEATQLRAWTAQCVILDALRHLPEAGRWRLLFEVSLPRMGRRADAVLLAGETIVVMEFKIGSTSFDRAGREQADDFALDLHDFHAGSRGRSIVPVLVATHADAPTVQPGLPIGGVAAVIDATPDTLAGVLRTVTGHHVTGAALLDPDAWCSAPYRPVPPIIEAARSLYARHQVEDIVDAQAGVVSLAATSAAIAERLAAAQHKRHHVILFVTGVPGAGKTLCGLNACFGAADDTLRATFLTGNPSLVHVLREALVRDARAGGMDARAARQRMEGVIQALPRFRDLYAGAITEVPPEHVVIIDEAQRSWSADYAIRKSQDRATPLTGSEPAHLLEAMGRHADWSAIVCLVGNGQEIHDGEGGLAEWGAALGGAHAHWHVVAAPDCLVAAEPRRRLPPLALLHTDARLHLSVPTRQIGHPTASDWVDAVLDGDQHRAAGIAQLDALPYLLTRDLAALRQGLRQYARGTRRPGLVASSGASRLRAEGLGVELPHMDAGAVASWFLDRFPPDVRASDALEIVATEFSIQGLELDVVGLCWDADLVRTPGTVAWKARSFRGTTWQNRASAERIANCINTYRVLLTRARHETIIWVPRGDSADATRSPAVLDAIAEFLVRCGVGPLALSPPTHIPAAADLFTAVE